MPHMVQKESLQITAVAWRALTLRVLWFGGAGRLMFSAGPVATFLALYFFCSLAVPGSAVSTGIVVKRNPFTTVFTCSCIFDVEL